ncbi:helix-turn-helix domain-containing protein, partial [Limnobacter sp.]|uniref:helix-turn-helix domain-containing protein n=1 Tax=Limnobacter sp. TaxID=2003368 RepID=UPI00311DF900
RLTARRLLGFPSQYGRGRAIRLSKDCDVVRVQYRPPCQGSPTAIALDLGFSDASAFSRACKRWFGKSPSEIRQDSLGASN